MRFQIYSLPVLLLSLASLCPISTSPLAGQPSVGGFPLMSLVLLKVSCQCCFIRCQALGFYKVPRENPDCNGFCINKAKLNWTVCILTKICSNLYKIDWSNGGKKNQKGLVFGQYLDYNPKLYGFTAGSSKSINNENKKIIMRDGQCNIFKKG